MNLDIDASIERLIADDFKDVPTMDLKSFIEKLSKAYRSHDSKWPQYATAPHSQVQRWACELEPIQRFRGAVGCSVLCIMNVLIIERPGPITLIWSERL